MKKSGPARPEIFVSATSQDLGRCRKITKESLLTIGCTPVQRGDYPSDCRGTREVLREVLSQADAMVHVVGLRFGAEPQAQEADEPRRSYAQLEYEVAKELGLPVYVFICGEGFPYDPCEQEPEVLQDLQREYRQSLVSGDGLYEEVKSPDTLALRIHALQDRVNRLSAELGRSQSWLKKGFAIALALFVVFSGGLWWQSNRADKAETMLVAVAAEMETQREYIRSAATAFVEVKTQLAELELPNEELWQRALNKVAANAEIPVLELERAIDLFVASVGGDAGASQLDKALAQFASGEFDSAGDLALLAAEEAAQQRAAAENLLEQVLESQKAAQAKQRQALTLAGQSRSAGGRHLEAVAAFELALEVDVNLREEEPVAWAALQGRLGAAALESANLSEGQEIRRLLEKSVAAHLLALEVQTQEALPQDWAMTQLNLSHSLGVQALAFSGSDRGRLLEESIVACRQALKVYTRESFPQGWVSTQNSLAIALKNQAFVASGQDRTRLLEESVFAYRQALKIHTRESNSFGWGTIQHNLAVSLKAQANSSLGSDRERLLKESVFAYRQALDVWTQESDPEEWALAQNNLAGALEEQAAFASGPERERLLEESISANLLASEVFTRESFPQNWARIQHGLATALRVQALANSGPERVRLLEEAAAAHRKALEVRTRESLPQDWAETQRSLARVLQDHASFASGPDRSRLLEQSASAYRLAIEVYTKESSPPKWAGAQNNLAIVLGNQAFVVSAAADRDRLLEESSSAYRHALEVYTRESFPQDWARLQNNLSIGLGSQAKFSSGPDRARFLEESISACRQALKVYTRESLPQKWASVQNSLAVATSEQAFDASGPDRARLLEETISLFRQTLEVYTREAMPQDWARTQGNLALLLGQQALAASGADRVRFVEQSASKYRQALEIYTRESSPGDWAHTQSNLAFTLHDQASLVEGAERLQLFREAIAAMRLALEVWTEETAPQLFFPRQSWMEGLSRELEESEWIVSALEEPQTVTDWHMAFAIGRRVWEQGNLDGAKVMEMRGVALAEAAGVDLNPSLGLWNGAPSSELNGFVWPLVDPDRTNQETDYSLGLVLIREAVAQNPNEAPLYDTLAWALFANGLWEEAVAASTTALEKAPADSKEEYQGYLDRMKQATDKARLK